MNIRLQGCPKEEAPVILEEQKIERVDFIIWECALHERTLVESTDHSPVWKERHLVPSS